jgi:hypothetical protein
MEDFRNSGTDARREDTGPLAEAIEAYRAKHPSRQVTDAELAREHYAQFPGAGTVDSLRKKISRLRKKEK